MIFDHIEWDEANLDHATKRLTATEIEQAIRNADGKDMNLSRDAPDRRLIRSTTDGGKRVAVVIQLVSNGGEANHGMGRVIKEKKQLSEAELANYYNRTGDLSEFEGTSTEPVEIGRRDVTISVRFSADEIDALRRRADAAGLKVTAFIRSAALEADRPLDREAIATLAAAVEGQVHQLREAVG